MPNRARVLLASVLTIGLAAFAGPAAFGDADGGGDSTQPIDFLHNVTSASAPVTGAALGSGAQTKPGTAICSTGVQTTANVNTDCEGTNPHNETSIAVNPTNPQNMIGGANDYQLRQNSGGHVAESVLSRAHVTFDGGKSWSEYPLDSTSTYQATGDPAVAFDATGHAYYATLGFRFAGPTSVVNADILVAASADSGKNWSTHRVATGSGSGGSVGDFLDKEYIAAWGSGNAIVTYGDFRQVQKGATVSAKIYASVTHDFGATWSAPKLISGSLDGAFASIPTVSANNHVYVAFLDTVDTATGADDYEVVEVDPATGTRIAGPFTVAHVADNATDYPIAEGRQTYQDSLFRTWAAGNITADPTNAAHLAVVWSDMRNSVRPSPVDPYTAKTNSDVVVSQSFDAGRTWSAATAVATPNDQFMPWGAFDRTGTLRIGTFDRSYDAANHRYGYSLLTETAKGSSTFTSQQVTTGLSDPTADNRWFADTLNGAFPFATTFLGDYSNIAVSPTGAVVAYWTDLRNTVDVLGRSGHGQDAVFASVG